MNEYSGKAIASMVLGIIAVSLCPLVMILPFFFLMIGMGMTLLPLACGIISLALGANARRTVPSGQATTGIILSIIAISLSGIVFMLCLLVNVFL